MKETGVVNFLNHKELHKEAIEEIETILSRIQNEDKNAVAVVQNALDNLLNGVWTPFRALKTVKAVDRKLSDTFE